MIRMTSLATAFAFALGAGVSGTALAGQQFVDVTGFAVSGYDVVSYFDLPQSPVGTPQEPPLAGRATITADYNGATFAFATEANRDRFVASPEAFVPQYDGHCAYGVAQGGKVPGNPTLWRIVENRLYLNITSNVEGFWNEDIPGNLARSTTNWTGIEAAPASENKIPNFRSPAPVKE